MIYDKINNWRTYFKYQVFEEIFDSLKTYNVDTEDGVYYYDGYYFKVMSYETKENPTIIESHLKEVDIQILLAGAENIKMYHLEDLKVIEEYNDQTDCIFYSSTKNPYTELTLIPDYMAIFFPSDPHHPQFRSATGVSFLKKIVIKVNLNAFQI
ncbi:MAG: YhcH/YjgK/YiaL family protein [Flavobacteriia bacterium]|nr:YhcH/YjgK/YiaL family protein [Flavobacteriia bacterium]